MYFCWLNDQQATHQMFILESEKRFYCTFVWFVDWSRLMSLSAQCPKVRFQCSTVIMSHLPFYLFLFFQLPKFLLWWFEILLSYDHNKMRNVTHDTVHEECVCVCACTWVCMCVSLCFGFIVILGLWLIAAIISMLYEHRRRCTRWLKTRFATCFFFS